MKVCKLKHHHPNSGVSANNITNFQPQKKEERHDRLEHAFKASPTLLCLMPDTGAAQACAEATMKSLTLQSPLPSYFARSTWPRDRGKSQPPATQTWPKRAMATCMDSGVRQSMALHLDKAKNITMTGQTVFVLTPFYTCYPYPFLSDNGLCSHHRRNKL